MTETPNEGGEKRFGPVKRLFLGEIDRASFFPFPAVHPEERETLTMVIESIDRFMADKGALVAEFDVKGEQAKEYIESLRELGLFGLIVPEEHGGIGLSNTGYSRALQQTSRYDASTSLTIGAHSSIGMKGLLLFGSSEQKAKYLPKLASGEMIAGFCLTEPGSGSDAGSIKTHAVKNEDGSWTLNGDKIWITNGPIAQFFTVFAKTDSPAGKMSAFIVERDWPGVSTGKKEEKMGIRASATSTVAFENVKVPADCLLGEEGAGFKMAMAILNNGRTGLGGGCVGAMKRCIALATRQAKDRKQFGKSIAEFDLIREKLAQMTVNCFVTESVVTMVGHYIDSGYEDYSVEAAMSKIFASEALWNVANDALQVAGGNGFMREYPYECIVRDSRINLIFEGTNEILRLFVALSGMKDAGEYLKEIGRSAGQIFNDPIKGFGVLSAYATKKVAQLTPLGHQRIEAAHPLLADEAAVFEQYTVALSQAVEGLLRKHGKNIIGQQFLSKRVAEISTDLFAGLCVLSRVTQMLETGDPKKLVDEVRIVKIFTNQAKRRMNQNLRRIEKNEDGDIRALADSIVERDGYSWDIL